MLYFAYGSNMDWNQMRSRCPSARFVGVAQLREFSLVFPRTSRKRQCGVASIDPSGKEDDVWGAVYQVNELDVGRLDKEEGFNPNRASDGKAYYRRELRVYSDGDDDKPVTAWRTYVAGIRENPHPLPSREYRELIVNGARQWGIRGDYVAKLERIEVAV